MPTTRPQKLSVFAAVAHLIPEQILIGTDDEGTVITWSLGAERLFGWSAREMLGQPIERLVPPEFAAERQEQIVGPVLAGETVRVATTRLHRDGRRITLQCVAFPLYDADDAVAGVSSVSFHDRELLSRDLPLRFLVDAIPAPALYREGDAFAFNEATERLIGYRQEEIPTFDAWFETLYGAEGPAMQALYEADRAAACAEPRTVWITRKDGRRRFVEIVGYLSVRAEVWFLRDVTDRHDLERELLAVSEREQRRIGRDLHDGLGAHLTGLAMLCRTLARRADKGEAVPPGDLDELADLVQEGIATARSLARGLNPVTIETEGIAGALQELATGIELRTGVRCRCVVDQPPPRFSVEVATHLYRIAQEASSNAIKHSGTDELALALLRSEEGVTLQIQDRGCGLPPDAESSPGLGLHAMRYRAGFVASSLAIESSPDGTTVSCTLPETSAASL